MENLESVLSTLAGRDAMNCLKCDSEKSISSTETAAKLRTISDRKISTSLSNFH